MNPPGGVAVGDVVSAVWERVLQWWDHPLSGIGVGGVSWGAVVVGVAVVTVGLAVADRRAGGSGGRRQVRGRGRVPAVRGSTMARWRVRGGEPVAWSTIDDRAWRGLQRRAAAADPRRADPFSVEACRAREKWAANYRNRRMN